MYKTKVCQKKEKPCCVVVVVGRAGQMLSASARPATALLSGDTKHTLAAKMESHIFAN